MKKTTFDLVNDIFIYYLQKYPCGGENFSSNSENKVTEIFEIPIMSNKPNPVLTLVKKNVGKIKHSNLSLFSENDQRNKVLEVCSTFENASGLYITLEDWIGSFPCISFREHDQILSGLRIDIIKKTNDLFYSGLYDIDN